MLLEQIKRNIKQSLFNAEKRKQACKVPLYMCKDATDQRGKEGEMGEICDPGFWEECWPEGGVLTASWAECVGQPPWS